MRGKTKNMLAAYICILEIKAETTKGGMQQKMP